MNLHLGGIHMTVKLVFMNQADFADFKEHSLMSFANEQVKSGAYEKENAIARTRKYFDELLPDDLNTKEHKIFTVYKDEYKVGTLWVRVFEKSHALRAFVYDIELFEEFRGQGIGTQTMEALNEYCKEMGVDTINLHVFGHNKRALSVYEKVGFKTTNYYMEKKL